MEENETIYELIKTIPFFANFTEAEKRKVSTLRAYVLRFKRNEVVVREGDFESTLYLILKGKVRVVKKQPDEVVLAHLTSGMVFGELAWLGKRNRTNSVIPENDVIVFQLDVDNIHKLGMDIKDKIKDQVIKILIKRLESMNAKLAKVHKS